MKKFTANELETFVHDHIQQKIDANELGMVGFDLENVDNFKREIEIYENTLFEGLINGILMCGCEVEGIETE